ncbi:MAG: ABC transporter ATP-binding protein [Elusimicrobia bacterium]|nr:ABC transporter ATP-binding protein [Elusimicrobiota bacterium]
MPSALRLDGIRRSFGRKEVLRGVTATAETGKVIGLLGRNGEGKSTLFKILLDLLEPDAGTVEVLGERPDGSGRLRRRIGYVPEKPVFHDFLNAGEVLDWRARFFPDWDDARARGLMASLKLDPATRVRGASKGQLAKLAWVCATAHDPDLLLLDEPTSGLDALVREEVLDGLIGELHAGGKTILIANHRMEELGGILDEVWVLSGGVLSAVVELERLRAEACLVTARLHDWSARPDVPGAVPVPSERPLAAWAAFSREAADRLAASGGLEVVERRPLALPEALKYLLEDTGGYDA